MLPLPVLVIILFWAKVLLNYLVWHQTCNPPAPDSVVAGKKCLPLPLNIVSFLSYQIRLFKISHLASFGIADLLWTLNSWELENIEEIHPDLRVHKLGEASTFGSFLGGSTCFRGPKTHWVSIGTAIGKNVNGKRPIENIYGFLLCMYFVLWFNSTRGLHWSVVPAEQELYHFWTLIKISMLSCTAMFCRWLEAGIMSPRSS